MFNCYLFLVLSSICIVHGQQLLDDEQIVTILPNDIEVAVREGQDLFLTCEIQSPTTTVTNCSWEMNGVLRLTETTIENRQHHTKHDAKCQIALLKVTLQDIGQWTCHMFTDDDPAIPKSATTQVSLIQRTPKTIAGLVTIIVIGLVLLVTYVITFGILKTCRFDNNKSFYGNQSQKLAKRQGTSRILSSRASSGENSDHFSEEISMTANPSAAIDRP